MPARYEVVSQKMSTLLDVSSAGLHTDNHYPVGVSYWVDPDPNARWASVQCRCGSAMRLSWIPETESYMELLVSVWRSMTSCSGVSLDTSTA